ncbi:MAG: DUF2267 domain-containing protein [Pseudomonadota bacterium]
MKYQEFLKRVKGEAGLESLEDAARITRVVIETLGERVSRTERHELAAQVPHELREYLSGRCEKDRYMLEEFYDRVTARADIGYPNAVRQTLAVMKVLQEAVTPGELQDILGELPDQYAELFGREPESPLSPTVVR